MTPGTSEEKGTPDCPSMGRASRSARSSTHGPSPSSPLMFATTPVLASPARNGIPRSRSRAWTRVEVCSSWKPISGWEWIVRRVETIRGSIDRAESSKSDPIKSAYSPSVPSDKPLGYGIDFGTSNSAVSVAYANRVDILPIGPTRSSRTLPSFVYLHRSGRRLAGAEGARTFLTSGHEKTDCWRCPLAPYGADTDCRQYRKGGGCNDARLLSGVKHELAKIGFAGTNSWATDFSVATLGSVVLKRLKTEADEATGHATTRLVLGHPVVFAGADRAHLQESEAEAFKRLREAAHTAGFEDVEFMAEPVAAVIGEERHAGVEIAVDFGGGTFDVAVMGSRGETPRITGTAGVAGGGELLDGALF